MATAGQQQLLHVVDSASGVRYLVDSGAQVSVVPFRSTKTPHSALLAADGRKIPTWGVFTTNVVINGHRYGPHKFVRAAVDKHILGADFFCIYWTYYRYKTMQITQAF